MGDVLEQAMLRIIENGSASGAKGYYTTADYYSEGQELDGCWGGKGAERLGLAGDIAQRDWDALCDNKHPQTGVRLTARQKEPRRVGYDFNFHCPKSVSLLYGLTQDERLLTAFREAVEATMQDMEAQMQTRVRIGGRNEDRTTGEMVWGEYVHTTARPVDGVPDPHLHAHCFVFNTTFDAQENRWKAGQFAGLKRDAPLYEAMFHARLARGLQQLGLPIARTRHGWELAGITKPTLDRFSRRTAEIEEKAREEGITDPKEKDGLGARTRSRKAKELSLAELKSVWRERLSGEESNAVSGLEARIGGGALPEDRDACRAAVDRAVAHVFARRSVVREKELAVAALKGAYGAASPEAVLADLADRPLLRKERGGDMLVSTREVLEEEKKLIAFARAGRGTCRRLAEGEHAWKRPWLNRDQVGAVLHILGSRDRVIMVRGAAGAGKTTMLKEAAEAIETAGHQVFAFAPSTDASRGVLRADGFAEADTVARLLVDERLQERLRGQVILIDEAGLLSVPDMKKVCDLVERLDARLILSGDARQHASVERGSPLKLLETEAGIRPAEVGIIQRQEQAEYRRAVQDLSDGRVEAGFRRLDGLGWIRELNGAERYRVLAGDYVETVCAGKTALVVSPTHREGEAITGSIRHELRERGKLGGEERSVETLANLNLTEAERGDAVNYADADVLVYHQNAKGHRKGDRVAVMAAALPLDQARHFQAFRRARLHLAAGDRVRITRNGKTADGKHALNNGDLYTVAGFDKAGNIQLANGWTVSRDYGHLAYGYVVTSHSSQGKTVQRVIIGQSWDSLPAASEAQFYVSVSRGKENAVIYTDNKAELLAGVSRDEERLTATELLRETALRNLRQERLPATHHRNERSLERTHG